MLKYSSRVLKKSFITALIELQVDFGILCVTVKTFSEFGETLRF